MIIWDRKKKILVGVIIALTVVLATAAVFIFARERKPEGTNDSTPPVEFSDNRVICPLDGTKVEEGNIKHPLAIMVENHTQARPQAGLDKASIVYEAVAEGGITRFMALFACSSTEKVGPVRSARTYYVDWAQEYNAFYAHAGGAQNALTKIVEDGVLDLNHNATAFWRQNDGRALDHTLYTSVPLLYQYAQARGYNDKSDNKLRQWLFKEEDAATMRPTEEKIYDVNFSSALYNTQWKYDPASNSYLRFLAGQPHKDEISGEQLRAKNVVIATYSRRAVQSAGKTVYDFTTTGSGEAKILRDGVVITGTWKKEGKDRTLFYDSNGREVQFNPGQTWIQVINPDAGSTNA